MKKAMVVALAALTLIGGCNLITKSETPEQVAKKQVEGRLAGLKADCTGLNAVVESQDETTAVVRVSGPVVIDQSLNLVKQDGRWVLVQDGAKK